MSALSPAGFERQHGATRVRFGAAARARLGDELAALGWRRVLAVGTPGRIAALAPFLAALGARVAGAFHEVREHVPAETVPAAAAVLVATRAEACLAVGGGSAIGLAKALARTAEVPYAALPTTYSGSEMTTIWGLTEGGEKRTGRDPHVAARLVLYDPELTYDLSPAVSAESGMNAVAHAVEALYAPNVVPEVAAAAEAALAHLARALPRVVAAGHDAGARAEAMLGAHLAGCALDGAAMGLHHRLCHVLGGLFGAPHARTHALLLPHVVAFNAPAAPAAMAAVARALGVTDAVTGLRELAQALGIQGSLAELGLGPADLVRAADAAVAGRFPNPRPASAADVRGILAVAARGD